MFGWARPARPTERAGSLSGMRNWSEWRNLTVIWLGVWPKQHLAPSYRSIVYGPCLGFGA